MTNENKKTAAWRRYVRFWGSNIPEDVDSELDFHLEMRVKEYVERGMSLDDARKLATIVSAAVNVHTRSAL